MSADKHAHWTAVFTSGSETAFFVDQVSGESRVPPERSHHWRMIDSRNQRFHAVRDDGTLWGWGRPPVGDGTMLARHYPVQIGTDSDWESVSEGDNHTIAKKTNGTVWVFGANGLGQHGNGSHETDVVQYFTLDISGSVGYLFHYNERNRSLREDLNRGSPPRGFSAATVPAEPLPPDIDLLSYYRSVLRRSGEFGIRAAFDDRQMDDQTPTRRAVFSGPGSSMEPPPPGDWPPAAMETVLLRDPLDQTANFTPGQGFSFSIGYEFSPQSISLSASGGGYSGPPLARFSNETRSITIRSTDFRTVLKYSVSEVKVTAPIDLSSITDSGMVAAVFPEPGSLGSKTDRPASGECQVDSSLRLTGVTLSDPGEYYADEPGFSRLKFVRIVGSKGAINVPLSLSGSVHSVSILKRGRYSAFPGRSVVFEPGAEGETGGGALAALESGYYFHGNARVLSGGSGYTALASPGSTWVFYKAGNESPHGQLYPCIKTWVGRIGMGITPGPCANSPRPLVWVAPQPVAGSRARSGVAEAHVEYPTYYEGTVTVAALNNLPAQSRLRCVGRPEIDFPVNATPSPWAGFRFPGLPYVKRVEPGEVQTGVPWSTPPGLGVISPFAYLGAGVTLEPDQGIDFAAYTKVDSIRGGDVIFMGPRLASTTVKTTQVRPPAVSYDIASNSPVSEFKSESMRAVVMSDTGSGASVVLVPDALNRVFRIRLENAGSGYAHSPLVVVTNWALSPIPAAGGMRFSEVIATAGGAAGISLEDGKVYAWGDEGAASVALRGRPGVVGVSVDVMDDEDSCGAISLAGRHLRAIQGQFLGEPDASRYISSGFATQAVATSLNFSIPGNAEYVSLDGEYQREMLGWRQPGLPAARHRLWSSPPPSTPSLHGFSLRAGSSTPVCVRKRGGSFCFQTSDNRIYAPLSSDTILFPVAKTPLWMMRYSGSISERDALVINSTLRLNPVVVDNVFLVPPNVSGLPGGLTWLAPVYGGETHPALFNLGEARATAIEDHRGQNSSVTSTTDSLGRIIRTTTLDSSDTLVLATNVPPLAFDSLAAQVTPVLGDGWHGLSAQVSRQQSASIYPLFLQTVMPSISEGALYSRYSFPTQDMTWVVREIVGKTPAPLNSYTSLNDDVEVILDADGMQWAASGAAAGSSTPLAKLSGRFFEDRGSGRIGSFGWSPLLVVECRHKEEDHCFTEIPYLRLSEQPADDTAAAEADIDGRVVCVGIEKHGNATYSTPPGVVFSRTAQDQLGGGATATAFIRGPVSQVDITHGGQGYLVAPDVAFNGPGVRASATASIDGSGSVRDVVVKDGGDYFSPPSVTFTPSPCIATISVTSRGAGYVSPPEVVIVPSRGGASAFAEIDGEGRVSSIVITNRGRGYETAPEVRLTGGGGANAECVATISAAGGGAEATCRISGKISHVEVNSGGSMYQVSPDVYLVSQEHGDAYWAFASGDMTRKDYENHPETTVLRSMISGGFAGSPVVTKPGRLYVSTPPALARSRYKRAASYAFPQDSAVERAGNSSRYVVGGMSKSQAHAIGVRRLGGDVFSAVSANNALPPAGIVAAGSPAHPSNVFSARPHLYFVDTAAGWPTYLRNFRLTAGVVRTDTPPSRAWLKNIPGGQPDEPVAVGPSNEGTSNRRTSGIDFIHAIDSIYVDPALLSWMLFSFRGRRRRLADMRWSEPPEFTISGPEGEGAAVVAELDGDGFLSSITVTSQGSGYTDECRLDLLRCRPLFSACEAVATVGSDGGIDSISLLSRGSGYSSPAIAIVGGGGSGAAASAIQFSESDDFGVDDVIIGNRGAGYGSAPQVIVYDAGDQDWLPLVDAINESLKKTSYRSIAMETGVDLVTRVSIAFGEGWPLRGDHRGFSTPSSGSVFRYGYAHPIISAGLAENAQGANARRSMTPLPQACFFLCRFDSILSASISRPAERGGSFPWNSGRWAYGPTPPQVSVFPQGRYRNAIIEAAMSGVQVHGNGRSSGPLAWDDDFRYLFADYGPYFTEGRSWNAFLGFLAGSPSEPRQ